MWKCKVLTGRNVKDPKENYEIGLQGFGFNFLMKTEGRGEEKY